MNKKKFFVNDCKGCDFKDYKFSHYLKNKKYKKKCPIKLEIGCPLSSLRCPICNRKAKEMTIPTNLGMLCFAFCYDCNFYEQDNTIPFLGTMVMNNLNKQEKL